MGAAAEADAQLDLLAELLPNNSIGIMLRGCAALLAGRRADAERALATLTSRYEETTTSADELAILSSWLGDYDRTLRWLKKGAKNVAPASRSSKWNRRLPRFCTIPGAARCFGRYRSRGGTVRSSEYFPSESGRTKDFGVVHQGHEAAPIGIPLMQRAKETEQSFTRGAALGHIRCAPRSTDESGEDRGAGSWESFFVRAMKTIRWQ